MRVNRLAALFAVLILAAAAAQATVFIPFTDRQLVDRSDAVVIGTVLDSTTRIDGNGLVVTDYRLRVEDALKGELGGAITVSEFGGRHGTKITFIEDSAVYTRGERALLFLRRRADGAFVTSSMARGKFTFAQSIAGERVVVRRQGEGMLELPRLEQKFEAFIRDTARGLTADASYTAVAMPREEQLIAKPDATASAYTISAFGKGLRWAGKENPASTPINFRVNGTVSGSVSTSQALGRGLGSWTGEPNAQIKLNNAGASTATAAAQDGENSILLDNSSAPPPSAICDGSQGCMVGYADSNIIHTYKSEDFISIQEADVLIRPGTFTQQALNSLLSHELGHAIGLRHSNQGTPASASAIMNSTVNSFFDGNLQDWDKEAVATVYGDGIPCVPPQVTGTSGGGTIPFGSSTTLGVTVTGTAPFTYQWYEGAQNDTNKPLGTSASQNSGSVTATKNFWVKVANECGNAGSATITVTPQSCIKPAIGSAPQSQTITSGQTVTLIVGGITGSQPLNFQWYEGPSGTTTKPVGTPSPIFNTPALTSTTSYWFVVSNACGSAQTDTITLTVPGSCQGPTVTVPTQYSVRNGERAVLMATGQFDSFQWYEGLTGDTNKPLASSTDGTSNFIHLLYVDVLGRAADPAGIATFTDMLAHGATRTQVAAALLASTEWRQKVINDAYQTLLGRNADAAGMAYWMAAMNAGLNDENVMAGIAGSPEYFTGHSGGVNAGFLEALYQDLLGRPVDPDARTFWLNQLDANSITRGRVAASLLAGSEYHTRQVNSFYQRFLRRAPTAAEAANLLPLFARSDEAVMAAILGSEEYGKTNALLITEPLTATKSFWIRASNSCKPTDSPTITVNVTCPLTINIQPQSATIAAGALPALSVNASGLGPLSYQWFRGQAPDPSQPVNGATQPTLTNESFIVPGPHLYWVKVSNGCTSVNSNSATITVTCGPAQKPRLSVPPSSPAAVGYLVQWSDTGANSSYELQEAKNRDFSDAVLVPPNDPGKPAQPSRRIAAKNVTVDTRFYYRVRGIGACNSQPGPYSDIGSILVAAPPPLTFTNFSAGVPFDTTAPFNLRYGVVGNFASSGKQAFAGGTFTITTDAPWLVVTPSTGTLPDDGSPLPVTITINPALLTIGSTTATMTVRIDSGSGKGAQAVSVKPVPITISKVTPVTPSPKSADPNPDSLLVPAVAHADGANNSRFVSDVRITNVSSDTINYILNFVATQTDGTQSAKQTSLSIAPGETKALNDVVHDWFGAGAAGEGGLGTLEIRPEAPSGKGLIAGSNSGGPSVHLATVASSRTYNLTDNGTYGQYIPAIPIAAFIGRFLPSGAPAAISLQQLAQNSNYRTNFGFVEGSGKAVAMTLTLLDASGAKLRTTGLNLQPFEHRQLRLDELFAGITVSDARLEVKVASDDGKVTAYASLLDNKTSDPLLVLPVQPALTSETRYVVPGVAELNNGAANFHTDMRLYNSGTTSQKVTLAYSTTDRVPPAPVERTLAPGEVLSIDNTLLSLWNISGSGGAVIVTTDANSALVVTARTFSRRDDGGTFGQFIPAVSPSDSVALGERPLEVLQLEQSAGFRSNLGLVEVTGQGVDLEITATSPDSKTSAKIPQHLDGNQFLQLGSVFTRFGFSTVYNGRITVKVVGGNGKVSAYGSVVDNLTQDPTYVPAQQ
ncbi:MAG TPA: DUF4214 domain-containing protein [Thermoanaerobaculia bacterium]|jgi:hypothetical protein|nr:DUF4214 domain-containing protein [Thermoanaerobaculia bacterium]